MRKYKKVCKDSDSKIEDFKKISYSHDIHTNARIWRTTPKSKITIQKKFRDYILFGNI